MKKLLYILLVLNIIGIVIGFFIGLTVSFIYSILILLSGILSVAPIIAILNNMEEIEQLRSDLYNLKYKIKFIEDNLNNDGNNNNAEIPTYKIPEKAYEVSKGTWECVKCGTVNKAGTDTCENCKAHYSPYINPTSNPYEKKKVSRWIKDKRK